MSDPQTPAEWQAAVDAADFFLLVDSACQYGLVVYDGQIHIDRCLDILRRGAAAGVVPSLPDRRRAMIAEYVRCARARLNISQRVLARRVGYSAPWLSGVELGTRTIDSAAWQRLHAALRALESEASLSTTSAGQ